MGMKTFSDEELIAHLRLQGLDKDVAAADRIEQLSAQLKMVLEREAETHRRHEAREDTIRESALREAEALAEAKLAKAVEALHRIKDYNGESDLSIVAYDIVLWTLAELEKTE